MAVVRSLYAPSKPERWEPGCNSSPLICAEPYSLGMSYQYVAPPSSQTAADMTQSAYSAPYVVPCQNTLTVGREQKEACDEEDETKAALTKSFSTPNTARIAQETQTSSVGEKKRNKLGYHRTSIACSHCRRRKIRCIATAEVPNRCVNCIRLKKECSFYPVDQQPGVETRSRGSTRPAPGPSGSSSASTSASVSTSTSSPGIAMGSPSLPSQLPASNTQRCAVAAGQLWTLDNRSKKRTRCRTELTWQASVVNGLHESPYGYVDQASAGWMTAETTPKAETLSMPWQSYTADSPMSAHFSPYAASASASHDEITWPDFQTPIQTPMRSMSLGGESSSAQQQLHQVSMAQNQVYERRASAIGHVYSPPFPAPVAPMASDTPSGLDTTETASASASGESWHHQQLLSPDQQHPYDKQAVLFDSWHYEKTSDQQHEWIDEQSNQAPSEAYYSS